MNAKKGYDEKGREPADESAPATDSDSLIIEEEDASDVAAKLKKLKDELAACRKEKQEYLDGWQRAKADLINARKRDEEDKRSFAKLATEDLVVELVPVLQSFDAAMADKAAWEKVDRNWRIGVEYIAGQLRKALTDHGLVEINPLGLPFDHTRDEGVGTVAVSDKKLHNTVVEVAQKGYSLNGKVLKAPRVKIGELNG